MNARARLRIGLLAGFLVAGLALPAGASAVGALQPLASYSGSALGTATPPGDQRLFVVGQSGVIAVFENGTTMPAPFLDISSASSIVPNRLVTSGGERGLLSMAFDPNYSTNGLFYVAYTGTATAGGSVGDLHLDEFQVSSNRNVADAGSRRPVMTISHSAAGNHNGGDLHFKGGYLYWSTGDGGGAGDPFSNGQNTSTLLGKLLRIDPHQSGANPYTVPADNPFVGVAGADEVWSYGLRNPFRWSFDSADGALVIGDVGQNAREEIDYDAASDAGKADNFGWDCREGAAIFVPLPGVDGPSASCPGLTGYTDPVFDYPHSDPGGGGAFGCAIIGGFVYHGIQIPSLVGRYLYSDSCNGNLRSIDLTSPSGDRSEGVSIGSPSSIVECAGEPYITTTGGALFRLAASVDSPAPAGACGGPLVPAATGPVPSALTLTANRHRVRRGRRVRLTITGSPCPAVAGDTMRLLHRGEAFASRTLDSSCQAALRPRIFRNGRFKVILDPNAKHSAATSPSIRIKLKP